MLPYGASDHIVSCANWLTVFSQHSLLTISANMPLETFAFRTLVLPLLLMRNKTGIHFLLHIIKA